jgi:4-amino-4-deoxy-L-arabinose transferase-like glycosyltransferase
MTGRKAIRWACYAAVAGLFAFGVWFRVSSLGTAPCPSADETIYGLLATRLIRGRSISWWTASGHLYSPFMLALEAPVASFADPSYVWLRLPMVVVGLGTIGALYALGARQFGRTTGLIAAALFSVLPIAIIFSRMAWEPSLVPLASVLLLSLAYRARPWRLLGAFVLGIALVHPTILALGPILLVVLLVQLARSRADDPARRLRVIGLTASLGALILVPCAWKAFHSFTARWTFETYRFGPTDWGRFATFYRQMFLGSCMGVPAPTSGPQGRVFWALVGSVVGLGSWRLARGRRWDRLALVVGVVATTAGLNVVFGPDLLQPGLVRYALFLVIPTTLAFACLLDGLLVSPDGPRHARLRAVQVGAIVVGGYLLVLVARWNWFASYELQSGGRDSIWTLRTEAVDPKERIARLLVVDVRRPGRPGASRSAGPVVVVTDDRWHQYSIEYFLGWHPELNVYCIELHPPAEQQRILRAGLGSGGYVVVDAMQGLSGFVPSNYPAESLRSWYILEGWHHPSLVFRLEGKPATPVSRR